MRFTVLITVYDLYTHNSQIFIFSLDGPLNTSPDTDIFVWQSRKILNQTCPQRTSDIFILIFYVYEFYLSVCLCAMCVPGTHGGQKRTSDPLELELDMVVSCHASTRNQM